MSGHHTPATSHLNTTWPTNDPMSLMTMGPTLLSSLLSMSAISEWLKLILIGGIFQICRHSWSSVYKSILDYFFITVDIAQTDACYNWIMLWLATQPSWRNPRNVQLGVETTDSSTIVYTSAGRAALSKSTGDKKISYRPSHSSYHTFWYKHRYLRINRWEKESTAYYKQKEEFLRLRIFSRDHQILTDLLNEAEAAFKGAQENSISIYVSDSQHKRWRHLATRRKRPLNSIVLDPGIKDQIVNDAREFLASQDWYAARGIPFRRGYLLYGAPGSGKTSMIQSLAGELELDIYIVSLSRAGLDDNELNELISRLPEKCIALMEDVDAAFTSTINRDASATSQDNSSAENTQAPKRQKNMSTVTLSGLLNALDGVAAQEGRLLFATTNKYRSLDPALIRPGRMDLHVEFGLASKHQARELYRRFYSPDGAAIADGSQSEKEETEELSEKEPLVQIEETSQQNAYPSPWVNISLPSLTQLENLATSFSDLLPEREFSMAGLQGYLMMYKTDPVQAVRDFVGWIEEDRKERRERLTRVEKEPLAEETGSETKIINSPTTYTVPSFGI